MASRRHALALSLARHEPDAEDLVQETFLRAYRSWDHYTPGTECRGWLFTICRNTFRRTRQRESRQVACDDPELERLLQEALLSYARDAGLAAGGDSSEVELPS